MSNYFLKVKAAKKTNKDEDKHLNLMVGILVVVLTVVTLALFARGFFSVVNSTDINNKHIAVMSEDISAPLILDEIDNEKGVITFIITKNVAGAIPTEPSVLWHGDKIVAKLEQAIDPNMTRQAFCVFKIVTMNGDTLRSMTRPVRCIGAIHERSGAVGLPLDGGVKQGQFASFWPSVDLQRQGRHK